MASKRGAALQVGRDSMGFEKLDEFWDNADDGEATDGRTSSGSYRQPLASVRSSVASSSSSTASRAGKGGGGARASDATEYSESFAYDTSDSISEEDEDDAGPSEETKRGSSSSSSGGVGNGGARRGRPSAARASGLSVSAMDESLPLVDSPAGGRKKSTSATGTNAGARGSIDSLGDELRPRQSIPGAVTRKPALTPAAVAASAAAAAANAASGGRDGARGRAGFMALEDRIGPTGYARADKVPSPSLSSAGGRGRGRGRGRGGGGAIAGRGGYREGEDGGSVDTADMARLGAGRGGKSPAKRPAAAASSSSSSSSSSSGRRGRGPDTANDDDNDDGGAFDDAGFPDDGDAGPWMDHDGDGDGRKSGGGGGRRVSFGADTKGDSGRKQTADHRRSSTGSTGSTAGSGLTPSTGGSKRERASLGSTPGSREFARGRAVPDESYVDGEEEEDGDTDASALRDTDDEDEDEEGASGFVKDTSFLRAAKLRNARALAKARGERRTSAATDDDDEEEDEEEEEEEEAAAAGGAGEVEEEDDDEPGARRSRRATKGQRLAFWMGERPVYQKGKMVGVLIADKEPTPPRRPRQRQTGDKRRRSLLETSGQKRDKTSSPKRRRIGDDDDDDDEDGDGPGRARLPAPVLPDGVAYLPREAADELSVWDDPADGARTLKVSEQGQSRWQGQDRGMCTQRPPALYLVVCHGESLRPASALPITATRPPGRQGVGKAAQSFNIPEIPGVMSGWISGFVELPAGAIKDAEGVGECSQVFCVAACQDDAVELGMADPREEEWRDDIAQRVLLKTGDFFYVPPGNIYRLENHSSVKSCMLYWTIVKPMENANYDHYGGAAAAAMAAGAAAAAGSSLSSSSSSSSSSGRGGAMGAGDGDREM